jgi:hypothetical protein
MVLPNDGREHYEIIAIWNVLQVVVFGRCR